MGHLHYWMIESESDHQETDPIVLWLNGGPGSSSLIGLLTENGQLSTNDDSFLYPLDGVPQVFYNSHGWTKYANMLYLESPKGVGFSYCDDVPSYHECINTDESTALDSYEFLVNWFQAFPEYKNNKFYITGESYAGIYIPMLMEQLDLDSLNSGIKVVGAAIGNGCWGTKVGTCAHGAEQQQINADFFFGHGMYSQPLREEILESCGDFSSLTEECSAQLDEMYAQMGDYDVYNIYDVCGSDNLRSVAASSRSTMKEVFARMASPNVTVQTKDSFSVSAGYSSLLRRSEQLDSKSESVASSSSVGTAVGYKCGGHQAMNAWLAEPSVMEALHVLPDTMGMSYQKTAADLLPLYSDLISKYQMLIYSGDTDGCVPYVGTEKWTRDMPYEQTRGWHQWFAHPSYGPDDADDLPLHKAGYAITYDKFQFVTVSGAGHMVPTFQPGYGLELFKKFLNNEEF